MFSDINLIKQNPSVVCKSTTIKKCPPKNFDEWLKENGNENWPSDSYEEETDVVNMRDEVFINCQKDKISEELEKVSAFDHSILDEISSNLSCLKETLLKYSSHFMVDIPSNDHKVVQASREVERNEVLYDYVREKATGEINSQTSKIPSILDFKLKTIENTTFPGYYAKELTPLPGSLEGPQLLDYITKLQDFPISFRKIWRKNFLSEPSVSMLQDTFWWVFLKYNKQCKDGRSKTLLFNRLSSSFVSLFLSVPLDFKDLFFKHYPNCLSQAVYAAFHAAFPSSPPSMFDARFREDIVNLIYEWVSGSHPHITDVIMTWKIDVLENSGTRQDVSSDDRTCASHKYNFLLKQEEDEENEALKEAYVKLNEDVETANVSHKPPGDYAFESHPLGRGCITDVVSFNIHGKSPLVTHYLATKGLRMPSDSSVKTVTRTELNEIPTNEVNATYKSLVDEHKQQSEARKKQYMSTSTDLLNKCKKLEKQQRRDKAALSKLHEELMVKQSDIKILSEKVMDILAESDFTTRNITKSIVHESPDDNQ